MGGGGTNSHPLSEKRDLVRCISLSPVVIPHVKARLHTFIDRLRASYWFIPSVMAILSVAMALGLVQLDHSAGFDPVNEQRWMYTGGAQGARSVLSVIAGSVITVAGTTFSITVAALSLASAQFGPRLLRNFMRDTGNQVVLGTFTATFLYCILVLRTIRGLDDNTYVPHISVTVGVLLSVLSVGVLIYFVHHVAESIQVSHIIEVAGNELDATIRRLFPEHIGESASAESFSLEQDGGKAVVSDARGYIQAIDEDTLMDVAMHHKVKLTILLRPGEYMLPGAELAFATPALPPKGEAGVRRAFALGRSRTSHQDATFAFRQLSEIALRALSPSINDPFTAMMCIDRITAGMCLLAKRDLPAAGRRDSEGEVRVIAQPYSYEDLVEAAYRHIREAAADYWQVVRHLKLRIENAADRASNPYLRRALHQELADLQDQQTSSSEPRYK